MNTPPVDRRITTVYTFQNGMVAVFDQFGEQMPEYQGPLETMRDKIRNARYDGPIAFVTYTFKEGKPSW